MKNRKQKQKLLNRISVIYLSVMCLMLICPPITRLFDRNDIWVGIMPLSQFYILFFTAMVVLGLVVTYLIDKRLEVGDDDE